MRFGTRVTKLQFVVVYTETAIKEPSASWEKQRFQAREFKSALCVLQTFPKNVVRTEDMKIINMKLSSLAIVLLSLFHLGSSASVLACPKLCKCKVFGQQFDVKCSSQKFLLKIDDKQADSFESLDLSNTSLTSLDKRLKKLKNLKHLDLSENKLKNLHHMPNLPNLQTLTLSNNELETLPLAVLPKDLKDLDISFNLITDLPKDISSLHKLESLHLQGNPINCDESAITRYVNLVSLKVKITEDVECFSPKAVNGKKLETLIADALLNPMLGDQDEATEEEEDPDNSEFIRHSTENPDNVEKPPQEDDLFEGSGEEGSGDFDKEDPSACVIDCSTFKPLEILKDNKTSPLISIKEQMGILFEDLFGKEQDTTTAAAPTPVEEEVVTKKTIMPVSANVATTKQTEKLIIGANESKTSEDLDKAAFDEGLTYYLIGTVIVLMVVVAIFIIVKKRVAHGKSRRRRNSLAENGVCEEMKPLGKYKEISNGNGSSSEKQKDEDIRPERIPLINGNGKAEAPTVSMEDLDITLRTPETEDGSSPIPERVTITSSEIPASVLKTPQLVHREINKDGEIVTKPLDDSY